MDLANRLKTLRREQMISQQQLANALRIHQTAVSQWETGRTMPDYDILLAIASYFGVSVDYLLGETDKKKPTSDKSRDRPDVAKNDEERKILMLARHLEKIPEEKRARIVKNFEDTIDTYLEAMGLDKEGADEP